VNRRIATATQQASRQIRDVLQSLLLCELLAPPERLWLVSAWIVDASVIDNRSGEVAELVPEWPDREILLSEVLAVFLASGTKVVIATNDHPTNRGFPSALRAAAGRVDAVGGLRIASVVPPVTEEERGLHRKRLVTERAVLWGSMNFTRSGYERNAEDVSLDTEPTIVAAAVNEMEQLHPMNP
jgi:phosphatidylserine/phosphatidylglycerophosphate/cardiolipin synthase-like enzyme